MKVSLNILTKDPSKCESKTRLRDILTDKEREFITKEMLDITCKSLSELKCDKYIHVYPNSSGLFMKDLSKKYGFNLLNQSEGRLSYKIFHALNFQKDKYIKRILIGSDVPSISKFEINSSIKYLDKFDCIFGPSNDNGFYLMAVKNNSHCIIDGLDHDCIKLEDLKYRCKSQNKSYKLIRKLKDIDTVNDLITI